MRISTTTLESYRLFMEPDQEWMPESELIATIEGKFVPNRPVLLGLAFGAVLEDPDRFRVPGGYRVLPRGGSDDISFSDETIAPALALVDRRGVFEAKGVKAYGDIDIVAKADHLLGAHLSEFKTTGSTFNFDKYEASCQWRFMVDIFEPSKVTYHVFLLDDHDNGVVELRGIESFNLYPYAGVHDDCQALVREFVGYVTAKGLDGLLRRRQSEAA